MNPSLYTQVKFKCNVAPIDYESQIVLLGSCFATNMSAKLAQYGFKVHSNPFGILFNPESIARLVDRAVKDQFYSEEDIIDNLCFDFQRPQPEKDTSLFLDAVNTLLSDFKLKLQNSSHVFITLGSAWVYKHNANNKVVANCHKEPQNKFNKELLSIDQITNCLFSTIKAIRHLNSSTNIIFTVSPIRHLKDGFSENLRSKSRSIEAVQTVIDSERATYFPSYEIVMDELRDYRFYASDMIHLNDLGTNMVWSRFRESVIHKDTYSIQNEVDKYRSLENHRPHDVDKHNQSVKEKKKNLLEKYPYLILD